MVRRNSMLPDPEQDIADGLLLRTGERDDAGRPIFRWHTGSVAPPWIEIPEGWDYAFETYRRGRRRVCGLVRVNEPQPPSGSTGGTRKRKRLRRRAATVGGHLRLVWSNPDL